MLGNEQLEESMNKHLVTGLTLTFAFVLGWSGIAQAQVSVPCSPEMIARLGVDPNPANGGEGCELWRHGMGFSTENNPADLTKTHVFFRTGAPPTRCGGDQVNRSTSLRATLTFEEPKSSVCDVQTAGAAGCPARLFGGGREAADQMNRSFFVVQNRNVLPFFTISNGQVVSHDGSEGTRYACDAAGFDPVTGPLFDMNNLVDECSGSTPGKTFVRFATDNPLSTFDNDLIVYDQNGIGDGVTNGSTQCCQDVGNSNCEDLAGTPDYPVLNVPLPNFFGGFRGMTPFVFEGGKGTAFANSVSQHSPAQTQGVCFVNRTTPCFRVEEEDANGDQIPGSPCDLLGDVCDYSERGLRVGAAGHLNDPASGLVGIINPGVCAGGIVRYIGNPIDPVTGISTGCWLPGFYEVNGDPQPGCLLQNAGTFALPDIDCDGLADDTDADGQPGPDLCPFFSEANQFLDSNGDGRGDDCQCGDGNGDGAISGFDISATAICANGVGTCRSDGSSCQLDSQCSESEPGAGDDVCDRVCNDPTTPMILDTDGDLSITGLDIAGIVAVVNGNTATTDLQCGRAISLPCEAPNCFSGCASAPAGTDGCP